MDEKVVERISTEHYEKMQPKGNVMKKMIVVLFLISLAGCDLSNPDSKAQKIAQDANQALNVAEDVITVVPIPSPLKETLLALVAVAGAAVGAIQSQKKKRADTTTEQIVMGIGDAIKAGAITDGKESEFTKAMNASQDTVTRKTVDKIQGK